MNKKLSFWLILFLNSIIFSAFGQRCTHTELSKTYNFQTQIKRIKQEENADSCIIKIIVSSKMTNKIVKTIQITSTFLLDDSSFVNCNKVRSYTTGVNGRMLIEDWDYGDLIVADFNFDNREDFAVKREVGGNGGPAYNYYIQNTDSTFVFNKFLSETLDCFPTYFNKNNKTLTLICRSTSVSDIETIYKFDTLKNIWTLKSNREINYSKK